ncbi:MAG: 16S rRNA (guanine(527)-N(7))-methyltransferase RsmG [Candidatus Obscuribacterales bacterium]|nr:16S rRNA (guanine(527)-N(7))-methyltransferase RsmG [Steroidobacteraceae bacterium]
MTSSLQLAAAELGVALSSEQATKLIHLLDELDDWNQRMNLTAIRERSQQITKHLLDSLSIHRYLRGTKIADIGTGAGFPGLPLALVNADKQFTLIDATAKKLRFVEHAAQVMGLNNVVTVHTRAESFRPKERFDCIVARAVGPINRVIEYGGHNLFGGGRLLAMKGKSPEAEVDALPSGWKVAQISRLTIPGLDEERHLVEIWRSHDKE